MSMSVPEFERAQTISFFRIVLYILLIAAGLWLVYEIRGLIPPFLIAIIIALTLVPEINRMESRGWTRGAAILLIYVLFIVAFAAFLIVLIPFISAQVLQISQHLPAFDWSSISSKQVTKFLIQHGLPHKMEGPVTAQIARIPDALASYLNVLGTELPVLAGQLIWIIIIPILAFYILVDYHKILGKVLIFVHPDKRLSTLQLLNDVVAVFGNYVRAVLLMMLLDIAVTYCILKFAHVQFAETVAVLTGILYSIPYLGAVISTLLIGLDALQNGLYPALGVLAVMVFVHQFLFDQIIGPRIMGKQVGLHPLWAIAAMLIGGTLTGVGGTLIAIPVAACARIVLVHLFPRLADTNAAGISELYMRESDKKAMSEAAKAPRPARSASRVRRNKSAAPTTKRPDA